LSLYLYFYYHLIQKNYNSKLYWLVVLLAHFLLWVCAISFQKVQTLVTLVRKQALRKNDFALIIRLCIANLHFLFYAVIYWRNCIPRDGINNFHNTQSLGWGKSAWYTCIKISITIHYKCVNRNTQRQYKGVCCSSWEINSL
jgi:hypothetical protein